MPHRTGISHAALAVFLSVLWVFFNRSLDLVVRDGHVLLVIDWIATGIHRTTGLSVAYSTVMTMVTIALVTVLAFAWGYTFHRRRFGGNV